MDINTEGHGGRHTVLHLLSSNDDDDDDDEAVSVSDDDDDDDDGVSGLQLPASGHSGASAEGPQQLRHPVGLKLRLPLQIQRKSNTRQ